MPISFVDYSNDGSLQMTHRLVSPPMNRSFQSERTPGTNCDVVRFVADDDARRGLTTRLPRCSMDRACGRVLSVSFALARCPAPSRLTVSGSVATAAWHCKIEFVCNVAVSLSFSPRGASRQCVSAAVPWLVAGNCRGDHIRSTPRPVSRRGRPCCCLTSRSSIGRLLVTAYSTYVNLLGRHGAVGLAPALVSVHAFCGVQGGIGSCPAGGRALTWWRGPRCGRRGVDRRSHEAWRLPLSTVAGVLRFGEGPVPWEAPGLSVPLCTLPQRGRNRPVSVACYADFFAGAPLWPLFIAATVYRRWPLASPSVGARLDAAVCGLLGVLGGPRLYGAASCRATVA